MIIVEREDYCPYCKKQKVLELYFNGVPLGYSKLLDRFYNLHEENILKEPYQIIKCRNCGVSTSFMSYSENRLPTIPTSNLKLTLFTATHKSAKEKDD